jgi:hypothetical protein
MPVLAASGQSLIRDVLFESTTAKIDMRVDKVQNGGSDAGATRRRAVAEYRCRDLFKQLKPQGRAEVAPELGP